ncbi:Shedu immune nuclease family protein [Rhodococcus sp. NM-2]|uniref:Shedu immune nuclease family protein n=1 Tax=Rhodococcus sp. NM-2 TaxID=3401174 RepID=UPI003AADC50C
MAPTGSETASASTLTPDRDPDRPPALDWMTYSDAAMSDWYRLLSSDPDELAVQAFLERHPAMIPGGSGDIGPGGHHGSEMSAVFREPELTGAGREFEPDFMWVTRASGLITPVLIEIERPSKRWFKGNGRPTAEFRDAHDQLNDWRSWFSIDENRALFRRKYLFFDRYENRPLEPQYVLIYGRQSEFEHGGGHEDPDSLRHKRDTQRCEDESFMTFDSLRPRYDHGVSMTLSMTAKGPRPFAFSPTYRTDTETGEGALLLGDPSEALARSVMMSDERKGYVAQRWRYWQHIESQERRKRTSMVRQFGYE